jgi:carboxymethylenebutenolidase
MIHALKADETAQGIAGAVPFLKHHAESTGKVGAIGFCWGGGMLNRMAVFSAGLKAAVAYYGEQPPADAVKSVHAALLLHYAGLDKCIGAGIAAYEAALKAANKRFTIYIHPNVNHRFNNETSSRYDKAATQLAWGRTIRRS